MPLPKRKSLPELPGLEDNFDSHLSEFEELEDLSDESFDNAYSDDEDAFSEDYYIPDEEYDYSEEEVIENEEELDPYSEEEEIEYDEKEVVVKPKEKPKKKKKPSKKFNFNFKKIFSKLPIPDLKDTKKLAIFTVISIAIILLLVFLISSLFGGNKPKLLSGGDKISVVSVDETTLIANVSSTSETPGLVQVLYENENGKIIICESAENDFSTKEKEVDVSCYNVGTGNIKDMKLKETKLIKVNYD